MDRRPETDESRPRATRARQIARALSQVPGVVWFHLDADERLLAWSSTAAAIVDPLGEVGVGYEGHELTFGDCLADQEALARWRAAREQRTEVVELALGGARNRVVQRLECRPVPHELAQDPDERRSGLVVAGRIGSERPLGLALLDADLVTVVDAWPAASAILDSGDGGRRIPFPTDQRAALQNALLRGQSARGRVPWGSDEAGARWLQLELIALRGGDTRPDRVLALVQEAADARRATLDLREREQRLRAVVEATSAATGRGFLRSLVKALSRALDVRVAYVAERLVGSTDSLRMLCLWSGRDFTSGYEYPAAGTLDGRVLREGPVRCDEVRGDGPGSRFGVETEHLKRFVGIPIPDSAGDSIGVLGVMSDSPLDRELPVEEILGVFANRVGVELERLRAEEALRASEDRWRSVLEHAPDLILSLDREGQVLFHNQPRQEGLPGPGERLDRRMSDVDGARLQAAVDRVFESGESLSIEFEARFARELRWYSARIGPLWRAELVTSVILVATDISDSKQRDAQRELRSAIEQQVTAISTRLLNLSVDRIDGEIDRALGLLGRAFRADRAALIQVGQDEPGARATHLWAESGMDRLPRQLGEGAALSWMVEAVVRGGELMVTETTWIVPDQRAELLRLGITRLACVRFETRGGRIGLLLLVSSEREGDSGIDPELGALVHISADLFANAFEREQGERQRAALEQELQHSQRLEAIGNLAGGIAHDFNNLLTGILGHASLLREQGSDDPRVDRAAQVIERAAQRASSMTSQLLGFARRREAEFGPVDLHDTIHETVELLTRTLPPSVDLVLDLLPGKGLVWGDGGLLTQVLVNLAVNAGDALPEGRGRVEFRTERVQFAPEQTLSLPELSPGTYLVLEVTDDGSGMSEGVVDRIFEPFFTTKEAGRGTGMGLSVVYGIVRKHGGAIRCRSAIGIGTSFRIWLPQADERRALDEPADEPVVEIPRPVVAPRGRSSRVLVVDDEDVVLETASALLESLGHRVWTARGGREAVELFERERGEVDLVLLDLMMPEMGGRECFRVLQEVDADVPVVLSSGWGFEGLADEIEQLGFAGFAQKPYRRDELAAIVDAALEVGSS